MSEQPIRDAIETILGGYLERDEPFGKDTKMWRAFDAFADAVRAALPPSSNLEVKASCGQGNWAGVPWLAVFDLRETSTTQRGVYVVYLFRSDMSGLYATLNQGVTKLRQHLGAKKARATLDHRRTQLRDGLTRSLLERFSHDDDVRLDDRPGLGRDYESSTVSYRLYEAGALPSEKELRQDLEELIVAYEAFVEGPDLFDDDEEDRPVADATDEATDDDDDGLAGAVAALCAGLEARGFVFEPWQVAAYVTALRTKPFVILAGISGTGKSRLPALVAELTGGVCETIPVRPEWTDGSELLGYTDLREHFHPGRFLRLAKTAAEEANRDRMYVALLDEMNLARVEHYFADILSRIEDRVPDEDGGYQSAAALLAGQGSVPEEFADVRWPPNLQVVGTVNMDESTHGFSRKVLDRAFSLEMSEVDLDLGWRPSAGREAASARRLGAARWQTARWFPRATRLGELDRLRPDEVPVVERVIETLTRVNAFLRPAQLQVGYRVRDEVALFVLAAREVKDAFRDRDGQAVDPLDLALQLKVLPRIAGGTGAIRQVLVALLAWTAKRDDKGTDETAEELVRAWREAARPAVFPGAAKKGAFPRTAARLALMYERLTADGFTSYWL